MSCLVINVVSVRFGIRSLIAATFHQGSLRNSFRGCVIHSASRVLISCTFHVGMAQTQTKNGSGMPGGAILMAKGRARKESGIVDRIGGIEGRKVIAISTQTKFKIGCCCCGQHQHGRDRSTRGPWLLGRSGVPIRKGQHVYFYIEQSTMRIHVQHDHNGVACRGSQLPRR